MSDYSLRDTAYSKNMTFQEFIYSLMTDKIDGFGVRILKGFLYVLSLIFGGIVRLRLWLYSRAIFPTKSVPRPVVSVGNISLGGTGKTPLVALIAAELKAQHRNVVILNRGYEAPLHYRFRKVERNPTHPLLGGRLWDKVPTRIGVSELSMNDCDKRDEARMLKQALPDVPVLVGANRFKNAQSYCKDYPVDIFILDDGFQHFPLKRDWNIVTIDAAHPWGNGCLIPRGFLREPLSALKRGDVFVLTKCDAGRAHVSAIRSILKKFAGDKPVYETVHAPHGFVNLRTGREYPKTAFAGGRVCSFCGIGDPGSFERTLKDLSVDVIKNFFFIDHHIYHRDDLEAIEKFRRKNHISVIVTTQKDAVKLDEFLSIFPTDVEVVALKIGIEFLNEKDEFFGRILHLLQR